MLIALYAVAAWCLASLFAAAVAGMLLKGATIWSPPLRHDQLRAEDHETVSAALEN